ncbi:hypothetical protein HHL16_13120 [Pseudoflavitalea sp. G-6-1-2]|uniref:lipopolysaccharide biosynthesis protein n=1 Tax=Pseudoflavitalea sp. G-6-1-2 TaxID=2728841 RepID=UPI00146BC5D5|nr:hypothetical protein [Pseudoflavitalea sp. G-6-1-2]NML21825.1 hypothetical protein [Pseudoflavitalea sp. G-6-1-2]
MGEIRKQVLQSSFLSYVGFLIGAANTYFFARAGFFTTEQYGLTQVILSLSQIIAPLATLGMTGFMNRFFPYYQSHLDNKKNDMLMLTVLVSGIGIVLMFVGCFIFEPLVIRKFQAKSPLLVEYYYWTLLFAFFFTLFTLLESYLYTLKRSVLPSFMKETFYRLCVTILIALYLFRVIDFGIFVVLFCCTYLLIVAILLVYLVKTKQFHFATSFSSVTKRFKKNIRVYVSYVYTGLAVNSIARQIDTIALAGGQNLATTGIYSLNQFVAAIIQVPYRGVIAVAGPHIAEGWKNKNYQEIARIYQRSSINLLLIGAFLFCNIWLNYDDGLKVVHIDNDFAAGKTVFLLLGICNVFELSTGSNSALLSTSPAWRFEFYSGLLLLALSIPSNIFAAKFYGMDGVAFVTSATLVLYNIVRLIFIWLRFKMWPFTVKTIYAILLLLACHLITWYLLSDMHSLLGIILRGLLFSTIFFAGVFYLKLTPDLTQFLEVMKKRLMKKK